MQIMTGANETLSLPDGTTAILVWPDGRTRYFGRVDGDRLVDLTQDPLGSPKPGEEHTELSFGLTFAPIPGEALQTEDALRARICRDKFGNIIKCPPR